VTGTYRHGRTYCQVSGCQARVRRAAEIELPMAWEQDREYTTLTVLVGVCPHHGREIDRRVRALVSARVTLPALLTVIDCAIETEGRQHRRLCELEAELRCRQEQLEIAEAALAAQGVGNGELAAVHELVAAFVRGPQRGGEA
jgi:hypothetical protein